MVIVAGLVFGLAPAFQARSATLHESLKDATRGSTEGRGRLAGNDFRTLQQIVDRAVSPRRFTVWLLGAFAAFALVLASLVGAAVGMSQRASTLAAQRSAPPYIALIVKPSIGRAVKPSFSHACRAASSRTGQP